MAVRKSGIYYSVLITRGKEGRKKGIGVNVLIGKRKEDVEVEEVKEGRGAARTTVVCSSASNAVVAHAEVCTPLDAWMSRAVASTRPPSTA